MANADQGQLDRNRKQKQKKPLKQLDLRIANKYRLQRKIGQGGFGDVYLGTHIETAQDVAIKLEPHGEFTTYLTQESYTYKQLDGMPGIPRVGTPFQQGEFWAMIMDPLSPNLEDLFTYCDHKYSLKTVFLLANQILERVEHMRLKNYLHRDLNPRNLLVGIGRCGNMVYIMDMGMATEHTDVPPEDHVVKSQRAQAEDPDPDKLMGTELFASVNGHIGRQQDWSDDLESLGYILIYFLRGCLPWQSDARGLTRSQRRHAIFERKRTITTAELCKDAPTEFYAYSGAFVKTSISTSLAAELASRVVPALTT